MSQTLQCPNLDYYEYRRSILKQIAGLGCFRLVTGRARAAGGNAAASLGVPRPGVASSKAKVLRSRAAGGAPSTSGAAGAHHFEAIAKWDTSKS